MCAALAQIPSYISLSEAGERLSLDPARLQELIHAGTLNAVKFKGETVVDETAVAEIAAKPKKEDLEEYKQFAHLGGSRIWGSEAERKYGVSTSTISRWVRLGYIKRLNDDGYRAYLDEQDVAYCAAIYNERKGQGKRIFNPDGTPYKTKAELAAEQQAEEVPEHHLVK